MTLDDPILIQQLNALIHEFVMGDYETMIAEKHLRGTIESSQVIRDFIARFPGKLIMTPLHAQKMVRAMCDLNNHNYPGAYMIAVNLWFDEGKEIQGDLLLEILCQENKSEGYDLLIYNVLA